MGTNLVYIWESINKWFHYALFDVQGHQFTLLTLLYIILSSALLIYFSKRFTSFLQHKLFPRYIEERGNRAAIASIIKYALLIFGFLFIFKSSGFDLSELTLVFGALGVGIGFGLQNITNNFISGIIILFERPIKVGDRIQVGDIMGDVVSISMRSTTIVTNDNISMIIPNSQFVNDNVINWSHADRLVRFRFPVGVAYKEDPKKVKEIVLKIAHEHPGVLSEPAPDLIFTEYGDNSLNFDLFVWTSTYIQKPMILKSELYYQIFDAFKEHDIEIPFPQRDIYVRSNVVLEEKTNN